MTFDMGGTSTDVCLIEGGEPARRGEREVGGLPVRTRSLDIHTVGAGGGSVAWVDPGGLLKVGPRSAGAVPGPAAYGRGGIEATVTDANLVLGRLAPADRLGGRLALSRARAEAAVDRVAAALGVGRIAAAAGIVRVVNVNMAGALRVVSVERGRDPRDFALLAYGGAGPLHAAEVAEQMGMTRVIVPPRPGLLSALGLLEGDARADFSRTALVEAGAGAVPALARALGELAARGRRWLAEEGVDPGAAQAMRSFEMRYRGQSFEIEVPLAAGSLDAGVLDAAVAAFHARHERLNGYRAREHPVEVVTARLGLVVPRPPLPPDAGEAEADGGAAQSTARREVWFAPAGPVPTPVRRRADLAPGAVLAGPAVLTQMDTTVLVPPGRTARVGDHRELVIEGG